MPSSAEACTSAEAGSSRLPHRAVAAGVRRPPRPLLRGTKSLPSSVLEQILGRQGATELPDGGTELSDAPHQITPSEVSTKLKPTTAPITAWVVEMGSPIFVAVPTQHAAPTDAENMPNA